MSTSISNFIESLKSEKRINIQIIEHKYIPSKDPKYKEILLSRELKDILKDYGIESFYSHQAEAINLIRRGEHVVIMTPTASGKSLIYNIPVLESIIENSGTRALYIFPLKGLEQDQIKNFNDLVRDIRDIYPESLNLPCISSIQYRKGRTIECAEVYDGDTTAYRRKKIRENVPNVIFTNPDMLHLAINPYHKKWEKFFRNLRFIIIDEIHVYRGVFGSHVAHVLRRLRRICNYWGTRPQFIAASATIANPEQLAEELTGLPFRVVSNSGAPQGGRHFIFFNPIESPYTETTRLFIKCLKEGLRTIVFTKARKITELIYKWTIQSAPELYQKISPYRAGFLPSERRIIEKKLFSGELIGVISTSALELGIDVGGLDCCILCGYPGSVSSTWQRAGRVGRQGRESLIIFVAIQDALDHYFIRNPEAFFEKNHEAVVIDTKNINILKRHIPCASSEVYLREDDEIYYIKDIKPLIYQLVNEDILSTGKKGNIWFSTKRMPQRDVGIRAIGESFDIVNESGKTIGNLSRGRVYRDAFPGSIYLHMGKQYQIKRLDFLKRKVLCKEVDVNYYTHALSREDIELIKIKETESFNNFSVHWGSLKITQKIIGYEKKRIFDRVRISRHSLDMPEYNFETDGLWFSVNNETRSYIESMNLEFAGTLHAVEHSLIASIPLFALCERIDIGGLSYTIYPDFHKPALFIYDGYEGGIGLTKRAFEVIHDWLCETLKIIYECPCTDGCPSCVQDPQCGSSNQPLDKVGAIELLKRWLL